MNDLIHDYSGVGVNPMYGQTGQSLIQLPSSPMSTTQPSEYDEISNTSRSTRPIIQPPIERKVTSNSLYASHSAALLRHPTISTVSNTYETTGRPFYDDTFGSEKELSSRRCRCVCSPDAALCISALLVIILSVMAITLSLLIQFGVLSTSKNNPTLTTITITNTTTGANSSAINSSQPTNQRPLVCDCYNYSVSTTHLLGNNFTSINNTVSRILAEIEQLKQNENITISEKIQLLSTYLSQIKAINNSLQQLRPAANTPRQPVVTELNLPTDITINHGDCTEFKHSCNISAASSGFNGACQTIVDYATETHILVSSFSSITSSQPVVNKTIIIVQIQPRVGQTFLPTDSVLEKFQKDDVHINRITMSLLLSLFIDLLF